MFSGVLNERHALSFHYDAVKDEAVLVVDDADESVRPEARRADVLLDAQGFLVGVDVGEEGHGRVVVMLGPHEAVDRKASANVTLYFRKNGELLFLGVAGGKALCRASEKNPYATSSSPT